MVIEDGNPQETPLILIHDGSGLIFHYFSLPEFGRTVYGLHDPHFFSNKQWDGGLAELAEHYWALIREELPPGEIVLGGWSLGGIIALEMSASLARCAPGYTITGVMMLDSVNPTTLHRNTSDDSHSSSTGSGVRRAIPYTPKYDAHTSSTTRKYITNAIGRTERLLESWSPPEWPPDACGLVPSPASPSLQEGATMKTPPVVLLRATQYVPIGSDTTGTCTGTEKYEDQDAPHLSRSASDTSNSDEESRFHARSDLHLHSHPSRIKQQQPICTIDTARHFRMLGWDDVDPNFTEAVLDIPGHHYSIFATENVSCPSLAAAEADTCLLCLSD